MNADGRGQRRLAYAADEPGVAWSPDGRTIAYSGLFVNPGSLTSAALFLVNPGGGPRLLTTPGANDNDLGPSWSPDGKRIVFVREEGGFPELWVIDADGNNARRLTDNRQKLQQEDSSPAWSPDGRQIAFAHTAKAGRGSGIFTIRPDGGGRGKLAGPGAGDPSWSPDGKRIVFSRDPSGAGDRFSPGADLYVMNADGSRPRRLTRAAGADRSPDWSPDGKSIVFSSRRRGYTDLYVIGANGRGERKLTRTKTAAELTPDWQRLPGG